MKKIITLAVAASALLAGPDIDNIVDYDAQDNYVAQVQEARQFRPTPVVAPVVTAPIVQNRYQETGSACCSNRDSVDLMLGYDLTDSTFLDNAGTLGIRYNKNIAPNMYLQAGYERVLHSNYRNKNNALKKGRDYPRSVQVEHSTPGGASGSNGSTNSDGSSTGTGTGSNLSTPGNGGFGSATKTQVIDATGDSVSGTQLDRFYLNGMYEFCDEYKLMPYVFGGLGYESVRHESKDLQSGGFVNVGGGVKYQLNEDLNLITEAKALKKFDNSDLDILGAVGLGLMFGDAHVQAAPTSEFSDRSVAPKHVASILPAGSLNAKAQQVKSYQPKRYIAPSFQTKKINFAQKDTTNYDRYDVVPIETEKSYARTHKGAYKTHVAQRTTKHVQGYGDLGVDLPDSYDNLDVVTIEEQGYVAKRASHRSYATTSGAYYIQIAALFKGNQSNAKYFNKLDEQGLNHKIKHTTVRGRPVQLLLVGPYSSRAQAQNDLQFAKRVERGAFVKKIRG